MLAGLRWFAEHQHDFDALCIVRGGGSRTDLAWFDDREVAFAVARHPLKILVGIGHQRDESVLDLIAHSEKTPTAVAAYLVRSVEAARQLVAEQSQRLRIAVTALVANTRTRLTAVARDLQAAVADRLARERAFLANAVRSLDVDSRRCLQLGRLRCTTLARDLGAATRLQLQRGGSAVAAQHARLRHCAERLLERAHGRLQQQAARQRLLDPMAVLGRGFALVRSEDGKVLPAAARLHAGQTIILRMRDGSARAKTLQVDLDARQERQEEE
jgi:exodeoxyribonuclease VII large subunit